MNLSNARAKEVLELCLANEDPEMRSLVYEIINASGLDPSDPMFLVLALTGQIRVFLEAAPTELRQLLLDWKKQNAESLAEITNAVSETKQTYAERVEATERALERVSFQCVSNIKEVGMATTEAIAEANSETLERVQHLKAEIESLTKQLESLQGSIQLARQTERENMTSTVEKFQQTTRELHRANVELKNAIWSAKKFYQQTSWARRAEWFTPLFALLIVGIGGGITGGWLTSRYFNSPSQQLGRRLAELNRQRLFECMNNNDTQCTIQLAP
ncbi:DUF6753 family protein [Myxosarcina sp. GI1(2024)]